MAMTLAEAQTKLALVEEQISKLIATGGITSYGINGRNVQRSIEFLERERTRLERVVQSLSGGSFLLARFREAD